MTPLQEKPSHLRLRKSLIAMVHFGRTCGLGMQCKF